jgi:hypothetical protein
VAHVCLINKLEGKSIISVFDGHFEQVLSLEFGCLHIGDASREDFGVSELSVDNGLTHELNIVLGIKVVRICKLLSEGGRH